MEREYERCRRLVETGLESCLAEAAACAGLTEAMRYSLLAGGKRVRPVLLLKFCEAAGGDMARAMPLACAVELLHTYSLIHDDLPCMDNDDLRRGKPTNHKVYGVCNAVLAGDALQAAAFEMVLGAPLRTGTVVRAGRLLAAAAGARGICGGQYLDMRGGLSAAEELERMYAMKTASLLEAACAMGVAAAEREDGAAEMRAEAAGRYARALGLAFQLQDDILDETSTTGKLGKPAGSDAANHKRTFVRLLGLDACNRLVREKTEEAKAALRGRFDDTKFLEWLADRMAGRES